MILLQRIRLLDRSLVPLIGNDLTCLRLPLCFLCGLCFVSRHSRLYMKERIQQRYSGLQLIPSTFQTPRFREGVDIYFKAQRWWHEICPEKATRYYLCTRVDLTLITCYFLSVPLDKITAAHMLPLVPQWHPLVKCQTQPYR